MTSVVSRNTSVVVTIAAVIVIVFGMQAAAKLLIPFLLAVFFALITIRPMLWLQSHKVPSAIAAIFVVLALMFIIAAIGSVVGTSIAGFTASLPEYQARLDTQVQALLQFISKYADDDLSIESFAEFINPGRAMGLAAGVLTALQGVLTNTFLILFTMTFILLEVSTVETKTLAAFGRGVETFERAGGFLKNLGRYLGIKTVVSMATGLVIGIITWAIGLDFPLLWAMLAFLLNYIPTIGSIIAAVPAVLLALIQLGPAEATSTAVGFVAVNMIFGNVIEPRLMGFGVGISPLVIFVGLVVWGWILGPVGMLLSVPLTMALKLGLESKESTQWMAILLGSQRDAEHKLALREKPLDEQAESA